MELSGVIMRTSYGVYTTKGSDGVASVLYIMET